MVQSGSGSCRVGLGLDGDAVRDHGDVLRVHDHDEVASDGLVSGEARPQVVVLLLRVPEVLVQQLESVVRIVQDHHGEVCQGWNWSLKDLIKIIGVAAMYVPLCSISMFHFAPCVFHVVPVAYQVLLLEELDPLEDGVLLLPPEVARPLRR